MPALPGPLEPARLSRCPRTPSQIRTRVETIYPRSRPQYSRAKLERKIGDDPPPPHRSSSDSATISSRITATGTFMPKPLFDNTAVDIVCGDCGEQHRKTIRWLRDYTNLTCEGCGSEIALQNELLRGNIDELDRVMRGLRLFRDNRGTTH